MTNKQLTDLVPKRHTDYLGGWEKILQTKVKCAALLDGTSTYFFWKSIKSNCKSSSSSLKGINTS